MFLGFFIVIVLIMVNSFVWGPLDMASNMVKFGGTPGYILSNFYGYQPFIKGLFWFNTYWGLLIITVSFLPVFTLEAQEGRLFAPLAWTKTFSMAAAAMLSVTLVPVLMLVFIRGHIRPEAENPVNRFLIRIYRPIIASVMNWKKTTIVLALVAMAISIIPASRLGSEFMPTLNEGTLFYMPTTLPGLSVTKAAELLQTQNKIIKSFPEVASVFGKAGRAQS